nr:hypothetical protein [Solirubrobacterales bacterium]
MPQPRKSGGPARKPTARKPAARKPTARKPADAQAGEDQLRGNLAAVRELLARGVVITGERIQETMDEAVRRGRMTREDAEELVQSLVRGGRKQTQDLLAELEGLLG